MIPAILQEALMPPGAILFRTDPETFGNPDMMSYEIGIQQPRWHKRFSNVFCYRGSVTLYFKHDMDTIASAYREHPGKVIPSEVAGKYWSQVVVTPETAPLASTLVIRSYELVLRSLPKRGQALIRELGGRTSRFLAFHVSALDLANAEFGACLRYQDHGDPAVVVGMAPAAWFCFNRLHVSWSATGRYVLEADEWLDWPRAMRDAVSHEGRLLARGS